MAWDSGMGSSIPALTWTSGLENNCMVEKIAQGFSNSVVSLKSNMHTYAVNFLKQGDV